MHDSSSSQEIETDYVIWHAPDAPVIAIRRRVMEGIHHEVHEVFASVPRRGAETGGILLGRIEGDRTVVEDFEPVPCEHRFGPSYRLSDGDRDFLRETLDWFRGEAQPGLAVLGFYRSHTQPDFGLSEEDEELLRTHFSDRDSFVLLIKPNRTGASVADFFVQRGGRTEEAYVPIPFPFTEIAVIPPQEEQAVELPPIAPEREIQPEPGPVPEPAAISWPPPRARLAPAPEPSRRRLWPWYTALTAVGMAAGALGYLALHPGTGAVRETLPIAPAPSQAAVSPAPAPSPSPAERAGEDPAGPATSDKEGIHALLDRWSGALKRGDARTASECYAPVVSNYYGRRNVTREGVQRSIRQSLGRSGRLDIYRVSDLQVMPVSEGRAVATFRKHWQTSGYRKFAGEEQDRLTLEQQEGAWRITSEQEQKLYWVHRPR